MSKRILILGSSGSGKSTLAKKLGKALKLPVYHLDQHFWKPGWVEDRPGLMRWQEKILKKPKWIIEGHFGGTLHTRLKHADTVIYLDFPTLLCLWRVIKRVAKYRGTIRPDMAEGCPEKWDWDFTQWVWNFRRHSRPGAMEQLVKAPKRIKLHILRTPGELNAWLEHHLP